MLVGLILVGVLARAVGCQSLLGEELKGLLFLRLSLIVVNGECDAMRCGDAGELKVMMLKGDAGVPSDTREG